MKVWKSITKDPDGRDPTIKQFGSMLVARLKKRGEYRELAFDTFRGDIVIDGDQRIAVGSLYSEYIKVERHCRTPIVQRYVLEWMKQVPARPEPETTSALRVMQRLMSRAAIADTLAGGTGRKSVKKHK